MSYLVTTRRGLEPWLQEELQERGCRCEPMPAGVRTDRVPGPGLRIAEDVVRLWWGAEAEDLDSVRRVARAHPVDRPEVASFRVEGERLGRHDFDRVALERAVGGALHEQWQLPVDLQAPELVVRARLVDTELSVGELVSKGLGRRPRPFGQKVSLTPVVAAAMVRFSGRAQVGRVWDPCCGAGSLLVEAGARWPEAQLVGGDLSVRAVEGAMANLQASGLVNRATVAVRDALAPRAGEPVDLVISNPPFGLQLGRKVNFFRFYRKLLTALRAQLSPEGTVVLLVHRVRALLDAAESVGFQVEAAHGFEMGSTRPTMARLRACST